MRRCRQRFDNGENFIRLLFKYWELGVIALYLLFQRRYVAQSGVIPVRVEDDDRVVLFRELLDNAPRGPSLPTAGHGKDCQVAHDNRASVDFYVNVLAVGQVSNI